MKKNIALTSILIILICFIVGYYYLHKNKMTKAIIKNISQYQYNDIIIGNYDASQSIILFFDYNCTYCKKFFNEVYPSLDVNYIQTGKVNLILKLVCSPTDIKALQAYQTVICINNHGDFQKLHKLLLYKNEIIYTEHFDMLIEDYITTNEVIGDCIINTNYEAVLKNIYQLQQLNTKGTPTFVINNKIINGFIDYSTLINLFN